MAKATMPRAALLCVGLCMLIGAVAGATTVVPRFTSVGQAVGTLPELSTLNTQVQKVPIATSLNSPDFVGTVFAPINEGLDPLVSAVGGDLTTLGSSVNDIFATSVLNTKISLEQLQNGQTLTASNGNTLTVTVTTVNGGKVYYINKARITTANILAGKAIIHEVRPILLSPTYQSMLEQMGFTDTSAAVPTQLYPNPTVTTPDPSPSPSPSPKPSPSPVPSPSPSPVPSPSPKPESSPAPAGSGDASSGSSGNTGSSPSPSPTPASSPAPGSSSGSDSGSNTGSPTGSPATNPGSPDPSTSTDSNPATGSTGTDPTSSSGSTTTPMPWVPPTTTNPSVTTESGVKKDPDLGLDISAGHRPVLATFLLIVPALVAALL